MGYGIKVYTRVSYKGGKGTKNMHSGTSEYP